MANPNTYMDSRSVVISMLTPNSAPISMDAKATDPEHQVVKLFNMDTNKVIYHLRQLGQFLGFAVSAFEKAR